MITIDYSKLDYSRMALVPNGDGWTLVACGYSIGSVQETATGYRYRSLTGRIGDCRKRIDCVNALVALAKEITR